MATITIKTAHGYLSLQPDGQIEYRSEAGAWETFTIEGFEQLTPTRPGTTVPSSTTAPTEGTTTPASGIPTMPSGQASGGPAGKTPVTGTDAIELSRAQIPASDCPDVRGWPIMAPLRMVEFAATECFERGDTRVDFPGRDALPAAIGSQGPIAYTLWMGCHIGGTWYIAPIVECIGGYVPTGQILATNQVKTNLFYYPDPPLRFYQPAAGEQVALFCTTGDTRRQNAQAARTPGRTNVVLVPFAVGRYTR